MTQNSWESTRQRRSPAGPQQEERRRRSQEERASRVTQLTAAQVLAHRQRTQCAVGDVEVREHLQLNHLVGDVQETLGIHGWCSLASNRLRRSLVIRICVDGERRTFYRHWGIVRRGLVANEKRDRVCPSRSKINPRRLG